jgi:K+-sensing histidine kinase KdpD
MARRWMRPGIVRWLSGLLASVLMVAAVSGLLQLVKPYVPPLHLLVLYVPVVLVVAIVWGTGLAAVSAVLSVAVFNYLLADPADSLEGAGWRSAVALGVFLVTAVVVGELAARLQRAAQESARLSREQAALRRVARHLSPGEHRPPRYSRRSPRRSASCSLPNSAQWSGTTRMAPVRRPDLGAGSQALVPVTR